MIVENDLDGDELRIEEHGKNYTLNITPFLGDIPKNIQYKRDPRRIYEYVFRINP